MMTIVDFFFCWDTNPGPFNQQDFPIGDVTSAKGALPVVAGRRTVTVHIFSVHPHTDIDLRPVSLRESRKIVSTCSKGQGLSQAA